MLNWVNRFNIFSFLDNNGEAKGDNNFSCMAAVGARRFISLNHADLFTNLKSFYNQQPGWLFGHINYPQEKRDEAGVSNSLTYHITIVRDHIIKGMSRLIVDTRDPFSEAYSF